jgi:hypothetical protein
MIISFEQVEKYLKSLGKNYSILFTFKKDILRQLKIHYASHTGEFYYSFRNDGKIETNQIESIDLNNVSNISFYLGLLVSSFNEEDFSDLLRNMENEEHFPIQKPDVVNRF